VSDIQEVQSQSLTLNAADFYT